MHLLCLLWLSTICILYIDFILAIGHSVLCIGTDLFSVSALNNKKSCIWGPLNAFTDIYMNRFLGRKTMHKKKNHNGATDLSRQKLSMLRILSFERLFSDLHFQISCPIRTFRDLLKMRWPKCVWSSLMFMAMGNGYMLYKFAPSALSKWVMLQPGHPQTHRKDIHIAAVAHPEPLFETVVGSGMPQGQKWKNGR